MGKNLFTQKIHRERAQPKRRRKLGMLEKHKDYILRARDFSSKRKQLLKLKAMARDRNPDEFRFGMENTHVDFATGKWRRDEGKGGKSSGKQHTAEEIRIMQTDDIAYLNMRRAVDLRKAEKLKSELHGLDAAPENTHTIFQYEEEAPESENEGEEVDGGGEAERGAKATKKPQRAEPMDEDEELAEVLDTAPEMVHQKTRLRKDQLKGEKLIVGGDAHAAVRKEKVRKLRYAEMEEREARAKRIQAISRDMEMKRMLSGPGTKYKKVDKASGNFQYVWKIERKK